MLYQTARLYAQVAGQFDAEAGRGKRPDPALRGQCQEQALRLIRTALGLLPGPQRTTFWRNHVRPDVALDPLRRSAGFARLELEYSRTEKVTGR